MVVAATGEYAPMGNMWTFMLLDQETGRTWQTQFSINDSGRGIVEIDPLGTTGYTIVPAGK